MKVALYARVSTADQSADLQIRELAEYAARRGWAATEYTDKGVSGAAARRPALDALMAAARRRAIDVVVVWKLDRFGRSLKHLVNALDELEALGVGFVSLRDNLDLSTPSGRLMFQIIGAMAEFERALIRERVGAGLEHARRHGTKSGRAIGRPRAVFRRDRVRELRDGERLSWREIAQKLGATVGTVRRVYRQANADAALCQNPGGAMP